MTQTPTKAEPLVDRMIYTFGHKRINACFSAMLGRRTLLDHLTDEARDELLARCIADHKRERKYAAASRKHYRERKTA